MNAKKSPPAALHLEVVEIERQIRPGCNSSTTSDRCTCRPRPTAG
jgi:hypothetical protein